MSMLPRDDDGEVMDLVDDLDTELDDMAPLKMGDPARETAIRHLEQLDA